MVLSPKDGPKQKEPSGLLTRSHGLNGLGVCLWFTIRARKYTEKHLKGDVQAYFNKTKTNHTLHTKAMSTQNHNFSYLIFFFVFKKVLHKQSYFKKYLCPYETTENNVVQRPGLYMRL